MATYWLKIAYFPYLIRRPRSPFFPLEFRGKVNREETRVMGAIPQWRPHDLSWCCFGMIPACYRKTAIHLLTGEHG